MADRTTSTWKPMASTRSTSTTTATRREDLTFRFNFADVVQDLKVQAGDRMVSVPLKNIGGIGPNQDDTNALNVRQTYTIDFIRGNRRTGNSRSVTSNSGETRFRKPADYIGTEVPRRTTKAMLAIISTTL